MIRSTVAHVDLEALKSNFLAITEFLRAASAAERVPGHPPVTPPGVIGVVKANAYGHGAARVGLALQEAGATMLACADIEEAIVLRKAGVTVEILVFGASGRQRSGRCVRLRSDTHDFDARRRQGAQCRSRHARTAVALSPEDRHGHEPAGLSLRQPRPHAAGAVRRFAPRDGGRVHALRDGKRSGSSAVCRAARTFRTRARAACRRVQPAAGAPPCGQQRRDASRYPSVVRSGAPRPAALRGHTSAACRDASRCARSCR